MGWDRGLSFEELEMRLREALKQARTSSRRAYAVVLLIALRNGARLGEAIDAVLSWEAGVEAVKVRVRKHRETVFREIVFPAGLEERLREAHEVLKRKLERRGVRGLVKDISSWCCRYLNFNPHSCRYAFISEMARRGVHPGVIAKITRHAKLDRIVTYIQEKLARDALRAFVREGF